MGKQLSIIITSYKNPSLLRLCLESLKKNVLNNDYEILVIDSATEEDTEMMMREEFGGVRFFPHRKNVGFAYLVNKGLNEAKGDYLFIMNADIIVEKKSIDLLIDYLKSHPDIGVIGPKLLGFENEIQSSCFRFYTPLTILYLRTFLGKFGFARKRIGKFLYRDKNLAKPADVDWIMGSALMTSRKNFEKVGFMEQNFGLMYFEDVDWCRRFWEKGLRVVYYPLVSMFHYHGKGSASVSALKAILFNRLAREHIKSALKYFWKYRGKQNPHVENFKS